MEDQNNLHEEALNELDKRVSVLEVRNENTEAKVGSTEAAMLRLMERVDEHMIITASSNTSLQSNLSAVTQAVTSLSSNMNKISVTLESLAVSAIDSKIKLIKFETFGKAIVKIISVLAVVVGAGWAIFTFSVEHNINVTPISAPADVRPVVKTP